MNTDIVVIGGGLHGLSVALHAAKRGLTVTLLERHSLGRHASGATAAGVRTLGRDSAELPLSLEAAAKWHTLSDFVGDDCGFTACGQLQVAEDEDALDKIRSRIERLRSHGYTHEQLLGIYELRQIAPQLSHHCIGAAWVPGDGSADPHRMIRAFRDAVLKQNVRIVEDCCVTSLERTKGTWKVQGSKLSLETPLIVNAAGAWSDDVAALAGEPVDLAIRTSMMVVTERVKAKFGPVVSSMGRKLSFKQTYEGTLLIGGGAQGRLAADRQRATIDAVALSASVGSAVRLFPAVKNMRLVRAWAGMEAMTHDHLPVLGFSSQVEGLIHVFGFSGHGFQLVPSVGRVIADLIVDGTTDIDLGAFDVNRVTQGRIAA